MRTLLILLALSLCFYSNAQTNPSRHHFNSLLIKDGMPEGTADGFLQDKQGYMWIGTQKGLVRFDGYKPKVYDFGIQDPYGRWVGKIFEDSKGQLWAPLSGGLYKYERAHDNFTQQLQWKNKYPDPVKEDAEGNIWLSLGDSLIRYDPVTKRSEGFGSTAKGKYHLDAKDFQIYKDKKQWIWVGSTNGLYEYNAKAGVFIAHLTHSDSSKQITIGSIQEDAQQPGIFYFDVYNTYPYGNQALGRYDSNTDSFTVFHHNPKDAGSIASDALRNLYTDSKGRLWIFNAAGLSLFDPLSQKFTNYIPDPADAFISTYVITKEDKAGNLWCSSAKGLFYFDISTKQFQRDTTESNFNNGLADNYILNLFIDRTGIVWLGANQLGLQWIDTKRSKFIQYSDGASADIYFKGGAVNAITKTPDGSTWMDTKNGLYHQTLGDNFKLVQSLPAAGKNISVGRTNICSNGLIGVWNNDKGKTVFSCYDPATGKTIDFPYNVSDTASLYLGQGYIRSICKDHLGDIWIGTWGKGIWRYNSTTKTITKFPFILNNLTIHDTHGALDDDQVQCIFEDKEGILWVGTNQGGLNKFNRDKGTFTSYVGRSPGFNCVINIKEDSKGRLWAGTFFGGVFELNKNTDSIKRFSEQDGLLYDGVWSTEEDNKGNIWAATPRGISIIDPATVKITNITNIHNFSPGSSVKTKEGNFYFSTDNGFIALNPDDFAPDNEPPVVHIESMYITRLIKNRPQDSAVFIDKIASYKLHYNENRLTFNYVGLYYKDPLATQYAYKLNGYDKVWVQAGTQRTVTYTNLSPGTYTFHVKAANSDGVWATKEESITVIISPPWWQTWWAYLLYAIVFAVAVWAFIAYRSRQLKQSNKILEHKIKLRTAEVLEQKEELAAQRDHLEKAFEDLQATQSQLIQSEKMASLGELTAGIAHEIQNPLNFVNNFSEVSNEMVDEMKEELATGNLELATEIADNIKYNLEKINHHGKRADSIVKGMLQHSRQTTGAKEPIDMNALCDEYLRLAYHGLRAKDKEFNADFKTDFDESIGKINIVPQDIGRVLLNLYNNAFYATSEKQKAESKKQKAEYIPLVRVSTRLEDPLKGGRGACIIVSDNANGIPLNIVDKIFQPFFTTKPTGSGTGLGLSLSYDIVKAHGGEIRVNTKEGEGSEFIIVLPVKVSDTLEVLDTLSHGSEIKV